MRDNFPTVVVGGGYGILGNTGERGRNMGGKRSREFVPGSYYLPACRTILCPTYGIHRVNGVTAGTCVGPCCWATPGAKEGLCFTRMTAGHILGQDCHTFVMGLPAGFQLHASCYKFVYT